MPQTRGQKILFSLLMSFMMVYGMEVYNRALLQKGLSGPVFLLPAGELLMLMAVVIVLETFLGGPLARKLAFRMVGPKNGGRTAVILAVQLMTVCTMCPMMSLVATVVFKGGLGSQTAERWVRTVSVNFPMALGWQILVAGPLVRLAVRVLIPAGEGEIEGKHRDAGG